MAGLEPALRDSKALFLPLEDRGLSVTLLGLFLHESKSVQHDNLHIQVHTYLVLQENL